MPDRFGLVAGCRIILFGVFAQSVQIGIQCGGIHNSLCLYGLLSLCYLAIDRIANPAYSNNTYNKCCKLLKIQDQFLSSFRLGSRHAALAARACAAHRTYAFLIVKMDTTVLTFHRTHLPFTILIIPEIRPDSKQKSTPFQCAPRLSRNYSFADKQERTVGRSKVVRKFLYRNFLPPEV